MEILIEKATQEDIDELEQLYNDLNDYLAVHTNYPGWLKGVYPVRETAQAGIKEDALYVARSGGRIVGTVILRHEQEPGYEQADWHIRPMEEEIYVIYTFAVHPRYRQNGIGKQLMDFAVDQSRKMNCKAIRLDVYEKNTPAIGLYKSCGFQYIDTVDLGYGDYGLDRFELYQKLL